MKTEDSTQKDARPLTASRPEAAPEGKPEPEAEKELTDEQIAAISGGLSSGGDRPSIIAIL